ncbi:sugar phosphate isomerase/epimerase family protein [Mesotoga sp.]|uniref:sugar phosphate isomerase/epimerase family protein n=1 Tax=Mesotoga sp. TaxID=2053577 RepID=UPI00345E5434
MKLITQDKEFFPSRMEEKLSFVYKLGFDGFEIDGRLLIEKLAEVKAAVRSTGLPVTSACGGYRGWIGDFSQDKRKQAIEDIGEILKALSKIGGKGIVVPAAWGMFSKRLPPMVPPRTDSEDTAVLLDSLESLNKIAAETDTFIYLEPLNRYEDHMLNTLQTAAELIEMGGFSNVRLTADAFHMNIEEADLRKSIVQNKEYIAHVHIADSNRYQPGQAHLDFDYFFSALSEIDYSGNVVFECRVTGDDPIERYRESCCFIRSIVGNADT